MRSAEGDDERIPNIWHYRNERRFAPKEQRIIRRKAKPESQKIREADENAARLELMRSRLGRS